MSNCILLFFWFEFMIVWCYLCVICVEVGVLVMMWISLVGIILVVFVLVVMFVV